MVDANKRTLLHAAATGALARIFIHAGAAVDARDKVRGAWGWVSERLSCGGRLWRQGWSNLRGWRGGLREDA